MNITRLLSLLFILVIACKSSEHVGQPSTAFTGATIIDGSGAPPVPDGVLLIQHGRVVAMGAKESVTLTKKRRLVKSLRFLVSPIPWRYNSDRGQSCFAPRKKMHPIRA